MLRFICQILRPAVPRGSLLHASNCKVVGQFSTESHHLQGKLHMISSFSIRKLKTKSAFLLQLSTAARTPRGALQSHCDHKRSLHQLMIRLIFQKPLIYPLHQLKVQSCWGLRVYLPYLGAYSATKACTPAPPAQCSRGVLPLSAAISGSAPWSINIRAISVLSEVLPKVIIFQWKNHHFSMEES